MEDDPARRPKRQCARAARAVTALPSVAHYVGYVEDNETPEQIMKKFETMEKVRKKTSAGARCDSSWLAPHGPAAHALTHTQLRRP
jgi:hypothetical protein